MKDRHKTIEFFINAFDYRVQTEFDINFKDGSTARCFALEPPEKPQVPDLLQFKGMDFHIPWITSSGAGAILENNFKGAEYHLPPEIFVSDGTPDSIVGRWVAKRDGVGGIHHAAYQVDSVQAKMDEWKAKGYAEFTSVEPMRCEGLTQVFSKPSTLTGIIFEFIERGKHGFCKDNVEQLMLSTQNSDQVKLQSDFPDAVISQ